MYFEHHYLATRSRYTSHGSFNECRKEVDFYPKVYLISPCIIVAIVGAVKCFGDDKLGHASSNFVAYTISKIGLVN